MRSDGFPSDVRLKSFLEEFSECTWDHSFVDAIQKREDSLYTVLSKICQFQMSTLPSLLKNGLLFHLWLQFALNRFLLRSCLVLHPAHHTLSFQFAYLSCDVVTVVGFTKTIMPTAYIVVLNDHGNALSDDVHVERAEMNGSGLLQALRAMAIIKPLPRPAKPH